MKLLVLGLVVITSVKGESPECGQTPIPPNCGNGSNNFPNFIVGGQTAKPYSWPWQAILCSVGFFKCDLHCGATVLSNQWVMTAGHCVYNHTPSNFFVRVGIYQHDQIIDLSGTLHEIDEIHLHPSYQNYPDPEYDVALLKVNPLISYSDRVQPICLPSNDADIIVEPHTAWVTGWGTTKSGGDFSSTLQQVEVPFVNADKCINSYNDMDNRTMLCAGIEGYDSCQGDSGGPLVVASNNAWYQYGITSFGHGCAQNGYPGVYGRVTCFCDWIQQTTAGAAQCRDRQ